MKPFERFLIYTNTEKDEKLHVTKRLKDYIARRGREAFLVCGEETGAGLIPEEVIAGTDCVIVLGGDGTMLRAAHAIGDHDVCMVGVNLGTLGFLTEIDIRSMEEMIDRLIDGEYKIEERMMLAGMICSGKHAGITRLALNDVVLSRSGILRLLAMNIYVNGQFLDTYEADGIIFSTPTGSTGYNLSAGGPIITPMAKLILLTPICPHSLSKKSVVFTPEDKIRIEVTEKRKTQEHEAVLSFDGYENFNLAAGDMVDISVSERCIRLVRINDMNFYEVLRTKIGGKA